MWTIDALLFRWWVSNIYIHTTAVNMYKHASVICISSLKWVKTFVRTIMLNSLPYILINVVSHFNQKKDSLILYCVLVCFHLFVTCVISWYLPSAPCRNLYKAPKHDSMSSYQIRELVVYPSIIISGTGCY